VTATAQAQPVATSTQTFKKRAGDGEPGAFFYLFTLTEESRALLKGAFDEDIKACAAYEDPQGNSFLTNTEEGPDAVVGADEVVASYALRVFTDKAHKNLVYVRHVVVTRTGHGYSSVSYSTPVTKDDPTGKDFTAVTELVEKQLSKTGAIFAE